MVDEERFQALADEVWRLSQRVKLLEERGVPAGAVGPQRPPGPPGELPDLTPIERRLDALESAIGGNDNA